MAQKSVAPLKIGFVLDDGLDKPDGVQQYILSVGRWMSAEGHDVHYLVGQTSRTDLPNVHSLSKNLKVRFNGNALSIPWPTSRRKLRSFLAEHSFDVLHIQTPYSPFMGGQLVTLASKNTAVIGTFHILPYFWLATVGNWLLGRWCHWSLKRFDAMGSVSPAAAVFAKQTFHIDTDISPNVINYPHFHRAKPLPKYDDGKLTVLFLGRLVPRKGSEALVQAVAKLAQRSDLPPFRLVVCGTGQLRGQLEQLIQAQGLEQVVELAGFVEEAEKPRYYASADIAIFPSVGGESFGIVLLEAMANGRTAVLGGDNPGYRSVLAAREELLFDPKNVDAIADKLEDFLVNADKREQAAAWGGHYVKNFDVAVVGRQLLETYSEALHKRRQL